MPLADVVHQSLLTQFADGTRQPGEVLNIAVLSRELNVSQTPIREALARLEFTGLVERKALKGYSVAPLFGEKDLIDLMAARTVIEPALTLTAGERVSEDFLTELRSTIDQLHSVATSSDDGLSKFRQADERFHRLIAEQADNAFLSAAYAALGGQIQRFRLFARLGAADAQFAVREHEAIYSALAQHEPERASTLMVEHLQSACRRALEDSRTVTRSEKPVK
uniref:GntR family transcriptional regulator n=1 Tax=unclassified Rhodococcus (in: high G+C Gram-positive bacteria) TaxID=192944 RepID=UPI001C3DCC71|nr:MULTISPECIES: GntR family transcriptional regulator [unclassified Rhodococcus (in: high G+C Gram-positive bacteria)]